jgi:hypothetical protein
LLQAVGGGDSILSIDDVFRRISVTVPPVAGLRLTKLGDLGGHILQMEELPPAQPSDEEKIEQAVAMQARRRGVRQQLDENRKAAAAGTH